MYMRFSDEYLVMCLLANAMAYSATTVFPADVWAATKTLSLFSKQSTACFWKVSSSNFHYKQQNTYMDYRYKEFHKSQSKQKNGRLVAHDFTR